MLEQEHPEPTSPITPKQQETLTWGLEVRAKIKAAEDALKKQKEEVNTALAMVFAQTGLKGYVGPQGSLALKAGGTTSSLNKGALVANLLAAGLAPDKIKTAIDGATEVKPRLGSVEFTARKE